MSQLRTGTVKNQGSTTVDNVTLDTNGSTRFGLDSGGTGDPVLFVDVSNNSVGINHATPSNGLSVSGDLNVTGDITVASGFIGDTDFGGDVTVNGDLTVLQGLTVDGNTLVVDDANTRVGINITSPGQTLSVNGITAVGPGTSSTPSLTFIAGTGNGLYYPGSGSLGFCTGGTEKARILTNGSFGLGITTPSTALDVTGINTGPNGFVLRLRQESGTTNPVAIEFTNNAANVRLGSIQATDTSTRYLNLFSSTNNPCTIGDNRVRVRKLVLNATENTTDGKMSLNLNDGGGNANICFNHDGNTAFQNGSAARITSSVDSTTGSILLKVADSVTAGQSSIVARTTITCQTDAVTIGTTGVPIPLIATGGVIFGNNAIGDVPVTGAIVTDVTLDDYETGTFTPNVVGATTPGTIGDANYAIRFGYYTKIGNVVTAIVKLSWSGGTGGAGNLRVTGLPYAGQNTDTAGSPNFVQVINLSTLTSGAQPCLLVKVNSNYAQLREVSNTTVQATGDEVDWAASGIINATLVYRTNP